jgi:hypothetical protein
MSDETEIGIEAITEDIHDPAERRAAARLLRQNSMMFKVVKWAIITLSTGILAGIGAELSGIISVI